MRNFLEFFTSDRAGPLKTCGLIVAAIGLSVAAPASASYTISIQEIGSDVTWTGSGSLDLSGLGDSFTTTDNVLNAQIRTLDAAAFVGTGYANLYSGLSGPMSFGGIPEFARDADVFSGDLVSIIGLSGTLLVPAGYSSGEDLGLSTGTYNGTNFASLGLTPGTYVYNFGTGASADSFTVQIGPLAAAVPEPGTWAMMLLGFGGMGVALRRRRQTTAVAQLA